VVTDNKDRPVAGVRVTFSVSTGGGSLSSAVAESDNEGRAQVTWTLGPDIGTQGVQATATDTTGTPLDGSPLGLSAQAIRPAPATILLRTAPGDTARNGVPFDQQPVLEVLDSDNRPVPQVDVVASLGAGNATLSGTTTLTTNAAGQVTYSNLALAGPQGTNSIRFRTEPALEISTGPIELVAGTPAALQGAGPLTFQGTVNSPVSPSPSVKVTDASGNGIPGVAVTFDPNRDGTVSPEIATTDAQGVAQVGWTLGRTANVQYSLTARIEGSAIPAVRFSATALPGAAGRLRVAVQPSSPTPSGSAFAQQPEIQVLDQNGNPTPQSGLSITATVSSGPTGSLQNGAATTNAEGRAVFSGLTLTGAVGNYTISFSAPGVTGVTSLPTTLTVGPAARLAFAVLPSTAARSRAPLVIQPVLQVQDPSGNPVAQSGISVAVSTIAERTTLSGETATTDANGRAVFTTLTLIGPPGPKPLAFSAAPLQGASATVRLPTVEAVTVSSGHTASAVAGSVLPSPTSWVLVDASTRPVPDADFTLSASSGGAVSPSSTTSDLSGAVHLESWTLGTAAGEQFVELKLPDGRVFRDSILATPDAPTTLLLVSGDNQSAPTNSELPQLLVVQVVDRFGNGVENVMVQWATCDGTLGPIVPTDAEGKSGTRQPTGSQPSSDFCTRASVEGLSGSPVDFHYTVTAAASTLTQLRSRTGPNASVSGLPPIPAERDRQR
jgi:adhesin/invasin